MLQPYSQSPNIHSLSQARLAAHHLQDPANPGPMDTYPLSLVPDFGKQRRQVPLRIVRLVREWTTPGHILGVHRHCHPSDHSESRVPIPVSILQDFPQRDLRFPTIDPPSPVSLFGVRIFVDKLLHNHDQCPWHCPNSIVETPIQIQQCCKVLWPFAKKYVDSCSVVCNVGNFCEAVLSDYYWLRGTFE